MALIEQELAQTRPIDDPRQVAILSLMKSTSLVHRELEATARAAGITLQQYHVLRILKTAGTHGLPVLDIAEQMIEDSPNVTRLVDRLAAKGLAERQRVDADRRVVRARLTAAGDLLLDRLTAPMQHLRHTLCGSLTHAEMEHLNRLLEKLRLAVYRLEDEG